MHFHIVSWPSDFKTYTALQQVIFFVMSKCSNDLMKNVREIAQRRCWERKNREKTIQPKKCLPTLSADLKYIALSLQLWTYTDKLFIIVSCHRAVLYSPRWAINLNLSFACKHFELMTRISMDKIDSGVLIKWNVKKPSFFRQLKWNTSDRNTLLWKFAFS